MTHDPDDDSINFDVPNDEPPRSERAEAMSDDEIDKEFNERVAASSARIQDGTIKDAGDFEDCRYLMEGENRAYECA